MRDGQISAWKQVAKLGPANREVDHLPDNLLFDLFAEDNGSSTLGSAIHFHVLRSCTPQAPSDLFGTAEAFGPRSRGPLSQRLGSGHLVGPKSGGSGLWNLAEPE